MEQQQAKDKQDAERYRWLRDHAEYFAYDDRSKPSPWPVIGTCSTNAYPCSGPDLDKAVDAAIAAAVKERKKRLGCGDGCTGCEVCIDPSNEQPEERSLSRTGATEAASEARIASGDAQ